MEPLKEKIRRFKQWQEQPYEYKLVSDKVQHCNNCGNDYTGNFCPICSQKAGMGRISWHSVRQGVMDIWGLGTRSLLYSIWQLLWRPGHFINDYINGKRQVSFPPVKMLFIVTVIFTLVYYWFLPHVLGFNLAQLEKTYVGKEGMEGLEPVLEWSRINYGWYMLLMSALVIIPTWILFRESPRNHHHSLPEGFFIQVLMAVLMVVIAFVFTPLAFKNYNVYLFVAMSLMVFFYTVSYKQLFGYGIWGTIWRLFFVLVPVSYFMSSIALLAFNIDMSSVLPQAGDITPEQNEMVRSGFTVGLMFISLMALGVGYVINLLATRITRNR